MEFVAVFLHNIFWHILVPWAQSLLNDPLEKLYQDRCPVACSGIQPQIPDNSATVLNSARSHHDNFSTLGCPLCLCFCICNRGTVQPCNSSRFYVNVGARNSFHGWRLSLTWFRTMSVLCSMHDQHLLQVSQVWCYRITNKIICVGHYFGFHVTLPFRPSSSWVPTKYVRPRLE